MEDVLRMGEKDGKYMKYIPLKEPGWTRGNTRYAQQFGPKPLNDFLNNQELARIGDRPPTPKPNAGPLGDSTYTDHYARYDSKKMKWSRQPQVAECIRSVRPPFTELGEGLLRTTSTTEDHFPQRQGLANRPTERMLFEVLRPRADGLLETFPLPFTTSYTDDFGIPRCGSNTASTVGSSRYASSLRSASQGSRSAPSLQKTATNSGCSRRSRASGSQRAMSEAEWSRHLGVHDATTQVAKASGV